LGRIGEPYISSRYSEKQKSGGGLGLGLFIATTLLERSGASLEFSRSKTPPLRGAKVTVSWPQAHLTRQLELFTMRNEEH